MYGKLQISSPMKSLKNVGQLGMADMKLCYFMIDSNTLLFQVRKYVYHDADNLDTAFDAGGKVSIGLTATTIVSQWTWSATLLQSSTVASKVRLTSWVGAAGTERGNSRISGSHI